MYVKTIMDFKFCQPFFGLHLSPDEFGLAKQPNKKASKKNLLASK